MTSCTSTAATTSTRLKYLAIEELALSALKHWQLSLALPDSDPHYMARPLHCLAGA